jgi:hypothetical protein
MRLTTTLSLVAVAIALGCKPNTRFASKDNLKLTAQLRGGSPAYDNVLIGTPEKSFEKTRDRYADLTIGLQGGPVRLGQLTVAELKRRSLSSNDLDSSGYATGWPKGSVRLELGPRLFFTVHNDEILQLYANSVGTTAGPRFGKVGVDKEFQLPLSHQEVIELFGKPDRITDKWVE